MTNRRPLVIGASGQTSQLADGDTLNASIIASGATTSRTLAARGADTLSVRDFGAVGDGVTDDTAAIQAAVAASSSVYLPTTSAFYKVTNSILPRTGTQIIGSGAGSTLKLVLANGTPCTPVIDIQPGVTDVTLRNFVVDHNAALLAMNTVYLGNAGAQSAILAQGDRFIIDGVQVKNAFGNGIFVVEYAPGSRSQSSGSIAIADSNPAVGSIVDVQTVGCGCGVGTDPTQGLGKIGAGINVGSGRAITVSNCVDRGSTVGFIIDIGAGAQCTLNNCYAYGTVLDPAHPGNGSGYSFYVGSTDCLLNNCYSDSSQGVGFWLDGPNYASGQMTQLTNCFVYNCAYQGFTIKGSWYRLTNCMVHGASAAATGTYDAFLVDTTSVLSDIALINCASRNASSGGGSNARYGYNEGADNNPNFTHNAPLPGTSVLLLGCTWEGTLGGQAPGTGTSACDILGGINTTAITSTGNLSLTATGSININSANTLLSTATQLRNKTVIYGATTDEKGSDCIINGNGITYRFTNDADNAADNWLTVTRNGYTPAGITLQATALNLNGQVSSDQIAITVTNGANPALTLYNPSSASVVPLQTWSSAVPGSPTVNLYTEGSLLTTSGTYRLDGTGYIALAKGIGCWGVTPPTSRPARCVTTADIIAVLTQYGLTA